MISRRALLGAAGAMVAAGKKRNKRRWPVGWGQSLFPLVIVTAGPGFQGFFAYSPAPGPGNLVESIASHAGTDPFGNAYLSGFTTYLHSGGTVFAINQNGFAWGLLSAPGIGGPFTTIGSISGLLAGDMQIVPARTLLVQSAPGLRTTNALMEVQGDLQAGDGLSIGQGAGIQTLVNGSTINTAGLTMQPVTAAASVTGIILQAGTFDGQVITLPSDAGAGVTITFAAAATSHVKTGVGTVIQPGSTLVLMWVASTALWYPVQ